MQIIGMSKTTTRKYFKFSEHVILLPVVALFVFNQSRVWRIHLSM